MTPIETKHGRGQPDINGVYTIGPTWIYDPPAQKFWLGIVSVDLVFVEQVPVGQLYVCFFPATVERKSTPNALKEI